MSGKSLQGLLKQTCFLSQSAEFAQQVARCAGASLGPRAPWRPSRKTSASLRFIQGKSSQAVVSSEIGPANKSRRPLRAQAFLEKHSKARGERREDIEQNLNVHDMCVMYACVLAFSFNKLPNLCD